MPRFSPGRTLVALLAAAGLFLAGCADSPTGPDVEEWQVEALRDLDCGEYGEPCEIDPIDVCVSSGGCDDDPGGGDWDDGGWPDDGDSDDPWTGDDPNDGGGGGGGGGGGDDGEVCMQSMGYGEMPDGEGDCIDPDPPSWTGFREEPVDTVPAPECRPGGSWETDRAGIAWCESEPLDDAQLKAVETALDRMEQLGPPCHLMAIRGRSLLQAGQIKTFDDSVFSEYSRLPVDGAGYKDGVAIHEMYFGFLDETRGNPPWHTNLQLLLAHEIEHSMKGPEHADPEPGQPEGYVATENDRRCSGLA